MRKQTFTDSDIVDALSKSASRDVEHGLDEACETDAVLRDTVEFWKDILPALETEHARAESVAKDIRERVLGRIEREEIAAPQAVVDTVWGGWPNAYHWRGLSVGVAVALLVFTAGLIWQANESPMVPGLNQIAHQQAVSSAPAVSDDLGARLARGGEVLVAPGELSDSIRIEGPVRLTAASALAKRSNSSSALQLTKTPTGATLSLRGGSMSDSVRLTTPVRIEAVDGAVRIGRS